jgi:murein tripeptide amidase MpaA
MRPSPRVAFAFFLSFLVLCASSGLAQTAKTPLTVAEVTNYDATSRYADVMAFIRELQKQSPLLRVETLCRSAEGRDVPLLILGNPVPASPLDLRGTKRLVLYIQANIHAGEVEGKEASLMLARDILQQAKPPYLDKFVILIAPIFNADGNEKIAPNNRRQQPGPAQGVGVRTSGQNLDLNRDAIKAESYEVQGLLKNVLNRWDPFLLVDCHTTDGAWHEPTVTYSWPLNPNGDTALLEYQRDKMLPEIEKIMETKYKTLGVPYGGFQDSRAPEKGWVTFDSQPRYVTNYIGIRNRMAILDENYVHADFKARVAGNYAFLAAILDFSASHADELAKMMADVDARTIARGLAPEPTNQFAVEFELKPLAKTVTILGFEMETVPQERGNFPRMKPTDRKKTYVIPYFADFAPKRTVQFPAGYLITSPSPEVVAKLLQHGLLVERLVEPAKLDVESFRAKEIKGAPQLYQGHRMNSVKGEYAKEQREFPAGTVFVTTAQPLGNVAAYLLEPESDDGLIVWNYFDKDLAGGGFGGPPGFGGGPSGFPIYRLLKPAALVKETVR